MCYVMFLVLSTVFLILTCFGLAWDFIMYAVGGVNYAILGLSDFYSNFVWCFNGLKYGYEHYRVFQYRSVVGFKPN